MDFDEDETEIQEQGQEPEVDPNKMAILKNRLFRHVAQNLDASDAKLTQELLDLVRGEIQD